MSSGTPSPYPVRPSGGGPASSEALTKRQYVRFAFYKADPAWRRLPEEVKSEQKRQLFVTIESFNRRMLLRSYTLMGTRADADFLLWQIAESVQHFQDLAAAIAATPMGAYLTISASYLAQTKRSLYQIRDAPGEDIERLIISPSEAKYLFVYPFLKTRPWYKLSMEERQRMMDEHIRVGRKYPSVKLNTTYSFGLDDQEFVLGFETDEPSDFLDLVQELRETDASLYTLRDTPIYTCINTGVEETLDSLGGPKIAPERNKEKNSRNEKGPEWAVVCPVAELPEGKTKVVYLGGQQIAVFNVGGKFYAISNRCSHARGPLSEGAIDVHECSVTCPWHYAKFDLKTGNILKGVASCGVPSYQVKVEAGIIHVGSSLTQPQTKNGNAAQQPSHAG